MFHNKPLVFSWQVPYDKHGKCSKISNTFLFLFSNKMLVIRAGIHKMLVRIANREDPDQTLIWVWAVGIGIFSRQQVFRNFRTSTVSKSYELAHSKIIWYIDI